MGEELDMNLFDLGELSEIDDKMETVDIKEEIDTQPEPKEEPGKKEKEEIKEELGEGVEKDPEAVAKKNTEDEDDDPDKSGDSASPDLYKSFATVLQEKGVFTSVESSKLEEIKDVEGLVDLVKDEISKHELSDLNDLQREALQAYRDGVPAEMFQQQKKVENNLDSITSEAISDNEDLRRTLIFQEYKAKGLSDERAKKLTQRSFDSDEDVDDAKTALESLKKTVKADYEAELANIEKAKQAQLNKTAKEQKELKDKIFNTNEIITGYDISEEVKKKVYDTMMTPVSIHPETQKQENELMKFQRENPQDFTHKLYYLFSITNGFQDFSYFTNKEKSNSVNQLENALRNSTHVSGGGDPSFIDDPNSSFLDIKDELVID